MSGSRFSEPVRHWEEWDHEEAQSVSRQRPITGRVMSAIFHVRECSICAAATPKEISEGVQKAQSAIEEALQKLKTP